MQKKLIQLNHEQEELKAKIKDFLQSEKTYFGIYGSAGTGKTFTIANSLNEFKDKIVFLGATNKVCSVLKNSLINSGFKNPKVLTIDRFFKFRIKKTFDNKSEIVYKFPSIKDLPSLVVIDEVSMITAQKFEQIQKLSDHCKIMLIGDYLQLPPIEEVQENIFTNKDGFKVSKIFNEVDDSFELTIQNRQEKGTDLYNFVSGFRTHMAKKMSPIRLAEVKANGVDIHYYFVNDPKLKEIIKGEDVTAICHKNLSVLNFNWLIGSTKAMRKDYRLNEINEGDSLLFDSFYFHKSKSEETSFYTSNLVKVVKIDKTKSEIFTIKPGMTKIIKYHELTVIDDEDSVKKIRYVHGGLYGENGGGVSQSVYGQRKSFIEKIQKGLNVQENKEFISKLNTKFADYQNSFAKLKRPYALTCHKAQGSTYDTVLIPVYDYYQKNHQDANQLFYVAISRAKKRIIFVNKLEQFCENSKRKLFSEFEKFSIASLQNYECANCGVELFERTFDIDHKIPLANGGKNIVENLQALCKTCHKLKSAHEKYNL